VPEEREKRMGNRERAKSRTESEEPGNMYLIQLRHFINSHLFLFHVGVRARDKDASPIVIARKKWVLFVENERTFRTDSP